MCILGYFLPLDGLPYQGPKSLVHKDDFGYQWNYQPPKDLHATIMPHLDDHFKLYLARDLAKGKAPSYLFLSGAGTGKSRNANEFHRTLIECSRKLKNKELEQRLKGAKVFHVDLENGSSVRSDERQNPLGAIGSRMLFQVLRGQECNRLLDVIRKYVPPSPEEVLKLVAKGADQDYASEFTAVLVVDGIQNLMLSDNDGRNRTSPFYGMLSHLFDLPLWGGFIIVCCTATVYVPVENVITSSSRARIFLRLDPLKAPTIGERKVDVFGKDDVLTRVVLTDCGGHARAISILQSVIAKHTEHGKMDSTNITKVMCLTRKELNVRYRQALTWPPFVFEAALRLILTRSVVERQQKIPGTNVTVDSLLAPGLVRFENDNDEQEGQGRLSAPYIWVWALYHRAKKEGYLSDDSSLNSWIFLEYDQIAKSLGLSNTYTGFQS
jgi:hypothetical protein